MEDFRTTNKRYLQYATKENNEKKNEQQSLFQKSLVLDTILSVSWTRLQESKSSVQRVRKLESNRTEELDNRPIELGTFR